MSPEPLRDSVESLTEELLTCYEELSLLYSLGTRFGRLSAPDAIAATALREAVDVLAADCGWVVLWENGALRVPAGCRWEIGRAVAEETSRMLMERPELKGKRRILSHNLDEDLPPAGPGRPRRLLASAIASGATALGYLCLGRNRTGRIFTTGDQKLCDAVATLTAVELDNLRLQHSELEKQRLLRELGMAREIQRWLLPREDCATEFVEAAGLSEPCYEIGGDYYDFFPAGSDRCLLVIADVTGKGAPASLQAAMIQGIVHGCARHTLDPSELMASLNHCIMSRSIQANYPTAFLATVDRSGMLAFTNAGHTRPLLIRRGGAVDEIGEGGPLLGLVGNFTYPVASRRMDAGDMLFLYTDGVTDAENLAGEVFGESRLRAWAEAQAGRRPAEAKQSLLATLTEFSGGCAQADDLTALLVEYRGSR